MSHVVCAGHVNWDLTLFVNRLPGPDGEACISETAQSAGGGAANVACSLASLDVAATLLGSVGDDEHGDVARESLSEAGVDCTPVVTADGETAVKYLVVDEDGEVIVLGRQGTNEAYTATDLPESTLSGAKHLHLTSQPPETAAALTERATTAGLTVSVDPGRLIDDRNYTGAIARTDYLFVNEREAETAIREYLGPVDDPGCTAVLKHGPRGAEVLTADRTYASHDGFPIDAVDTTGAGDAFAAGFLATVVGEADPDFERALAVANACGALAASERGPRASLSWTAVECLLD